MNKTGVKFTYYRIGTTISRMTDYEKIEDLYEHGIEQVALQCLDETPVVEERKVEKELVY